MEHGDTVGQVTGQRQCKNVLLRYPFMRQFRIGFETKPLIVVGIADKNTTLGSASLEQGQAFLDEGLPNALFLKCRQH